MGQSYNTSRGIKKTFVTFSTNTRPDWLRRNRELFYFYGDIGYK